MSTTLRTIVFGLGFATLGAVTVIGTTAIAQQGRQGMEARHAMRARGAGGPGMGQIGQLIADLDLNENQEALAQELRAELREQAESHREERLAEKETIMAALEADPVDSEAIHALIDERLARQSEMHHAIASAGVEFFETLTSEQQAVVLDRAERARGRQGRMRQAMQEPPAE